ncbi:sigma-E factor negative regulatory protein [Aquaspirillum sp. LM1]|uniref:sigma-E factor negative regulatory protein n=1 Tax=Aquaspirillum sp. LM1 TaxID=1938604 RepID=UPI000984E3F9|nr:sigma-E factor negative regulatory protein [Aquaspirillum sp. LM1]
MMNEQFSALVDGELDDQHADTLLTRMKTDPDLQHNWNHYHLIGDALRQSQHLTMRVDQAVHDRLVDEPTVLAPRAQPAPVSRPGKVLRWAGYAMAASAALVAVMVGGQWDGIEPDALLPTAVLERAEPVQTLAMAPTPSEAPANNPYLLAHQESVSPYLMAVSTSTVEGRR